MGDKLLHAIKVGWNAPKPDLDVKGIDLAVLLLAVCFFGLVAV